MVAVATRHIDSTNSTAISRRIGTNTTTSFNEGRLRACAMGAYGIVLLAKPQRDCRYARRSLARTVSLAGSSSLCALAGVASVANPPHSVAGVDGSPPARCWEGVVWVGAGKGHSPCSGTTVCELCVK